MWWERHIEFYRLPSVCQIQCQTAYPKSDLGVVEESTCWMTASSALAPDWLVVRSSTSDAKLCFGLILQIDLPFLGKPKLVLQRILTPLIRECNPILIAQRWLCNVIWWRTFLKYKQKWFPGWILNCCICPVFTIRLPTHYWWYPPLHKHTTMGEPSPIPWTHTSDITCYLE